MCFKVGRMFPRFTADLLMTSLLVEGSSSRVTEQGARIVNRGDGGFQ